MLPGWPNGDIWPALPSMSGRHEQSASRAVGLTMVIRLNATSIRPPVSFGHRWDCNIHAVGRKPRCRQSFCQYRGDPRGSDGPDGSREQKIAVPFSALREGIAVWRDAIRAPRRRTSKPAFRVCTAFLKAGAGDTQREFPVCLVWLRMFENGMLAANGAIGRNFAKPSGHAGYHPDRKESVKVA